MLLADPGLSVAMVAYMCIVFEFFEKTVLVHFVPDSIQS